MSKIKQRGAIIMKKRIISWLAYLTAVAVMLSAALVMDMPAAADGEAGADEEEYDDSDSEEEDADEEDDDDDAVIDTVVNFQATSITRNSVTLKWDKVEDIDGYEISYKKASASKWKTILVESPDKVTYVVNKLAVNTKYNFRVRAYIYYEEDEEDYEDEEEDVSGVTDDTDEEDDDYEDDEEDYDDEWDDYEYGDYSKMTLKTLDKNGKGDKTAVSSTYEAAAHVSVKTPKLKSVKSKAAKKAEVKWSKSNKATGYEVYVSLKKNSGYKRAGIIKKNKKAAFTVKKLKSGRTYYVKVRAYVKNGRQFSYTRYSAVKKVKIK